MVVDAVIAIGNDDRLNMIGIKKVCDFNMKTWISVCAILYTFGCREAILGNYYLLPEMSLQSKLG